MKIPRRTLFQIRLIWTPQRTQFVASSEGLGGGLLRQDPAVEVQDAQAAAAVRAEVAPEPAAETTNQPAMEGLPAVNTAPSEEKERPPPRVVTGLFPGLLWSLEARLPANPTSPTRASTGQPHTPSWDHLSTRLLPLRPPKPAWRTASTATRAPPASSATSDTIWWT